MARPQSNMPSIVSLEPPGVEQFTEQCSLTIRLRFTMCYETISLMRYQIFWALSFIVCQPKGRLFYLTICCMFRVFAIQTSDLHDLPPQFLVRCPLLQLCAPCAAVHPGHRFLVVMGSLPHMFTGWDLPKAPNC